MSSSDEPSLRPQAASFLPLNPLDFLDRAGIVYPDKIAVVSGPRTITYGDFRDRAADSPAPSWRPVSRRAARFPFCSRTSRRFEAASLAEADESRPSDHAPCAARRRTNRGALPALPK